MTTLEERIAQVVAPWIGCGDCSLAIESDDLARAVVAVLPPVLVPVDESADGDIGPISGLTQQESDDFMEAIVTEPGDEYAAKSVSVSWTGAAVRAALDAQAAAHGAEVEGLRQSRDYFRHLGEKRAAEVEALRETAKHHVDSLRDALMTVDAERIIAAREVEALRDDIQTGETAMRIVQAESVKAHADRDAYRARIDAVRDALTERKHPPIIHSEWDSGYWEGAADTEKIVRAALDGA